MQTTTYHIVLHQKADDLAHSGGNHVGGVGQEDGAARSTTVAQSESLQGLS